MLDSAILMIATALAGGVGAVLRYVIDTLITAVFGRGEGGARLPIGTITVNVIGSFAMGVLLGGSLPELIDAAPAGAPPSFLGAASPVLFSEEWVQVLGVGLLGGFTTMSAASLQTVQLLQRRRFGAAAVNGLGQLVVAVFAALLGFWGVGLLSSLL